MYVLYLLLFLIWVCGVGVMLGHRLTRMDALPSRNTIPTSAKDFSWLRVIQKKYQQIQGALSTR